MDFNQDNFTKEVLQAKIPVLVDFWARWCAPCQVQGPIVAELAKEADGFKVGKVNVDENQEISSQYGVRSIPTLMIFNKGKVVEQMVGLHQKRDIKEKINSLK